MELQDVQNKLNLMLSGTERKIVFWYDDDAAYEEDIEQLELAPGNKKWILTQDNWFETKLLLEVQDTTSNYLVYAPFSRPEDKDNFLADIFYYSEHFYSDKMIQLCGELGVPIECQSLTPDAYQTGMYPKQDSFYNRFVKPLLREGGREGRVIVIISDAFRYECAKELQNNLDLDEKCDAKISHMLGVLPSETTLGMASLLPHDEILVGPSLEISVDGMKCGNSMDDRRKILQKSVLRSDCYDFDVLKNAKQAEVREMLQDKEVVYIYQNQIDDRGESKKSENEVFNACQEAIEEIQMLIRRLTGYVSATRFLITADHGFIYKRDKLHEYDKISLDKSQIALANKRYLLSFDAVRNDAMVSRAMTYLGKLNRLYVTTPMGVDIIKTPGGGQNYVHGGSSLQEMIIPVIKVITYKGKQDTSSVNVELSYSSNRITDIMVYLDFMQMEAVTDTLKSRKLMAFFVDEAGTKISYDVPIIANSTENDPRKRVMKEKFILKSGNYSRGKDYYLVLADMEDEKKEHQRYRFEIDIAGIL